MVVAGAAAVWGAASVATDAEHNAVGEQRLGRVSIHPRADVAPIAPAGYGLNGAHWKAVRQSQQHVLVHMRFSKTGASSLSRGQVVAFLSGLSRPARTGRTL